MCGFVATHEALLRQHMGSQKCVKGKVVLHCDECSFQTQFQPYLKKHIRTVHEKLPCTVCGKIVSKVRLTIHMNIFHTEEKKKPFVCKTCNKGFSCKKSFQEHSNIHTGERPFQCDLCEKDLPLQEICTCIVVFLITVTSEWNEHRNRTIQGFLKVY